jgi:DNA-binding SARP family transcriptional activator
MEFRLLGPLEVWRDSQAVDVRGTRRRAVLALLALHANEVVRSDRLIEELWGEHPPANAAAALQNHISRLRKELGAEALITKPWGYVLRVEPEGVDFKRFEKQIAESKPLPARERRDKLAEALALWRGPALADLAKEPALAVESARLDELRLSALEQRIDADLELGADDQLVSELEALVGEHPLRERLRGQLILALYRSGRQAEALETYRETRRVLVEELGIEPSAELRELERAILRQDPALVSTAPSTEEPSSKAPEPLSRWRWPRSPLLLGAAFAVALAGAGSALLLHRHGGPGEAAAVLRATQAATIRDSTEPAAPSSTTPRGRVRPKGRTRHAKASRPTRKPSTHHRRFAVTRAHASPPPPPRPPQPPPPPPPPAVVVADNFDDGVVDPQIWNRQLIGNGVAVDERNGRLEVSIPEDAATGTGSDDFDVGIWSQCRFDGNFDVSVDYALLDWALDDRVLVLLTAAFRHGNDPLNWMSIARASWTGQDGEGYSSFSPPGWTERSASGDQSGSLRVTRVRELVTVYYRAGHRWRKLGSFQRSLGAPGGIGPFQIGLHVLSPPNAFAGKPARIAFDNFYVSAATRICA